MNNKIKIITLSPDRWPEYKALRLRALKDDPQAFGSSYEKEVAYPDDKWQERVTKAFEGKNSWMTFAQENNSLLGIAGAFQSEEDQTAGAANIVSVYLMPESRGKGISKKLMGSIIKNIVSNPGIKKLKLTVNKEQLPAVKLYESFGFEKVGEENNKMGNGKIYTEYLMEKIIRR